MLINLMQSDGLLPREREFCCSGAEMDGGGEEHYSARGVRRWMKSWKPGTVKATLPSSGE